MEKAVIVTGGAGFIGCALSGQLKAFGLPVVAIDNLHPQIHAESKRPEVLDEAAHLHIGDVTEENTWGQVLENWQPTIVVHLAAETGTGQSLTEATRHAHVNVVGTTAMLDAFSARKLVPEHVLLASSRAVYGEGAWLDANGTTFYPPPRSHEVLARSQWNPLSPSGRGLLPRCRTVRILFFLIPLAYMEQLSLLKNIFLLRGVAPCRFRCRYSGFRMSMAPANRHSIHTRVLSRCFIVWRGKPRR